MNRLVAGLLLAFACLWSGRASAQDAASNTPVTFSKDIAPIIFAKCGVCHRSGGAAPFSLLTYGAARGHATQIAMLTRSGQMPPWQADGDHA